MYPSRPLSRRDAVTLPAGRTPMSRGFQPEPTAGDSYQRRPLSNRPPLSAHSPPAYPKVERFNRFRRTTSPADMKVHGTGSLPPRAVRSFGREGDNLFPPTPRERPVA
jgi:hypothetical protein